MNLRRFCITFWFLCISSIYCVSSQAPIAYAPPPDHEPPANEEFEAEEMTQSLWELLEPWRGIAMICFWAIVVVVIVGVVLARYCMEEGRPISRMLRRGKYSNYNFVSVYSETEAEIAHFGDDYDSDKLAQDAFDEISIIK